MVAQIHSHPSAGPRESEETCPTCEQPVSHLKFEEITARLAAEEQQRDAELGRQVAAAKAAIAKQAQEAIAAATKTHAAQLVAARTEERTKVEAGLAPKIAAGEAAATELVKLRADHRKELTEQRAALEKDRDKVVRAQMAENFRATERMRAKVTSLQRQLEHKTADDLGEGAEVDVFETLKSAFPDDRIRRVKKGEPGADIVHEVMRDGRVCGSIVYDSKNRQAWQNGYVSKLKADQIASRAEHAVLATAVFPSGARQVAIQDGVLIVNPARVLAIVQLLRAHLEQVDTLRLGRQARDRKASELYAFITSDRSNQLFDQIEELADTMLELEVKEKKAHDKTWSDRGRLLSSIQRARASLELEIGRIVGAVPHERSA